MKPKLKDHPREWVKFSVASLCMLSVVSWLLHRRGVIGTSLYHSLLVFWLVWIAVSLLRPRWLRFPYRVGMTLSFWVGQIVGRLLLLILFLFVLTPLGLTLRLFGKDLLGLKKRTGSETYWKPVERRSQIENQF